MNSPLFPFLCDHLWQSTLFAACAGLLTLGLRHNRARVRHALWFAASVKFAIPLAVLIAAGSRLPGPKPAPSGVAVVVDEVSQPFTMSAVVLAGSPAKPATRSPLPAVLVAVWACGFAGISCAWWVRWRRLAAAVRAASPIDLDLAVPVRVSRGHLEPGVFGIFRSVLLLPEGIFNRLTAAQLETVIAHELQHVRRRDNLVAAFQMLVETVFWFHPLVWWIGQRMVEERERACDEAVLAAGGEPRVYAEAMLNICKLYVESPLVCVSGVTGANLKKRIEAIMTKRIARELDFAKRVLLAAAGTAALILPIAIGMVHSPLAKAHEAAPVPAAPPVPFAAEAPPAADPQVAPAPQAVPAPQTSRPPQAAPAAQATPQIPVDTSQYRAAYAAATSTNPGMRRTYTAYGPPDGMQTFNSGINFVTTWHYNYLEDFRGKVDFTFNNHDSNAHVSYPPPLASFTGQPPAEIGEISPLASALVREMQSQHRDAPASTTVTPGIPGHATIEVYTSKQPAVLKLPLNTFTGRVDVIAQVVTVPESGSKGATVANLRDYLEVNASQPAAIYETGFTLTAGAYVCKVLVREAATGLMYTESISFQLK